MKQINVFLFGNGFTEKFIAPTNNKVNYHFVNTRKIGWRKYFKKNLLNDENNIFLITHQAWNTGWNRLLNKLKKHSNCYYYFLYAIGAMKKRKYEKISNIFSGRMLTYDKTDSESYNIPWVPYPTINFPPQSNKKPSVFITLFCTMPKEKQKDPHRFDQCYWLIKKIGDIPHRFALGANGLPNDATKEAKFIGEHSNFVSKGSMTKDYEYSIVDTNCVCFISQRRHEYISVTIPWAITNNKKILTDINIIKTFPGYDPKWIKIIPDFKKIDAATLKWLTDPKIVPNYTHKDYYCAKNFVTNIKKALKINKKIIIKHYNNL